MDAINKVREAIPDLHKNVLSCLEHVRNLRSINKRLGIALHGITPEKAVVGREEENAPEDYSGAIQNLELSVEELRSELLLTVEEYSKLISQLLGD